MFQHPLLVVPPEQEAFMKEFQKHIKVTVRAVRSIGTGEGTGGAETHFQTVG
jgi:hypothetical protein